MIILLVLTVLGVGMVIYAVFGMFTSASPKPSLKLKILEQPLPAQDSGKEQKIQRLQSQVAKLESQLEQVAISSAAEKTGLTTAQEKEEEFSAELKRREEWVAKAEAELAKVKAENVNLNNRFMAKENELQEEFAKNVNLTRQIQTGKADLEAKELVCRLKEDQLQALKHQSESQQKSINEHLTEIAEFKRKEKISEWVPKQEFNRLNDEYTKLEKELEAGQERLKVFASEIAHLRQAIDKKVLPVEEIQAQKVVLAEVKPAETKLEEAQALEVSKVVEVVKVVEEIKPPQEGSEKNTEETGQH